MSTASELVALRMTPEREAEIRAVVEWASARDASMALREVLAALDAAEARAESVARAMAHSCEVAAQRAEKAEAALDAERAARVKAERERDEAQRELQRVLVAVSDGIGDDRGMAQHTPEDAARDAVASVVAERDEALAALANARRVIDQRDALLNFAQGGHTSTAAVSAALRDYPDADVSALWVPASEALEYQQAWHRDVWKGRGVERERDDALAALAALREARAASDAAQDASEAALVAMRVLGRGPDEGWPSSADPDCPDLVRAWRAREKEKFAASARFTTALLAACATPSDLAAQYRARVRAEAFEDAADAIEDVDNPRLSPNSAKKLRALAEAERGK